MRWALALQQYDVTSKFKAGRTNVVADCLSYARIVATCYVDICVCNIIVVVNSYAHVYCMFWCPCVLCMAYTSNVSGEDVAFIYRDVIDDPDAGQVTIDMEFCV